MHYLVEGGSLLRTFIIFVTAGLVFMVPAFYFSRPDRRVQQFVARGAGMLRRSPRTPVQRHNTAGDDAGPGHTG
ncbi:hypothetical protein KZZ52_17255 [Dactylosporangium sp. AC04546]|uniref:hypothetical protein n=1 Tax=Dactylosporangium sp. AC04546 TaxID=2862460 RepID=UPI001EDDD2E1|nr:hypothetical protein [Dactylosporangium sp. AC04546]WVK87046.1 hypothetical protein KZZ52_17255 [Dactylosporangium sp. AC04546]